ncbi:alpha-amylase family protein [Brachybacterium hainanense]|uniref:Alpha-amylase family protein n=1 Tax=Brachybacterium hainanense TaxID=1541174 RepID=A0ABV6RAE3_9MICO
MTVTTSPAAPDPAIQRARDLAESRVGPFDPEFAARFAEHFPRLRDLFGRIYGERADRDDALVEVLVLAATSWRERPEELKRRDAERAADPGWFASERMLGGVCYVDRFAGTLRGMHEHIGYFQELGLIYLHLMPLFAVPEGNNDGGYAVSSYRRVDPRLGTMEDLADLAAALREAGISLVVDVIFNHTSDEHEWARKAVAGDPEHEDFYLIFEDRAMPDAYERTTREIFPDDHRGSFVQLEDGRWIWSTFYHFQWDLNYANPAVFRAMAGEMLFLAAQGVEVLRMAAPSLLFTSEAIVHPDEVIEYISPGECQISYNPLQMALTWEALATRDARLLNLALERRHALPAGTAWVNYVRSHDDIGWTFADEDAAQLGIDGYAHRRFLNDYYVGRTVGSFARGAAFQENPRTGDARVAGTTASLAGIEKGDAGGEDRVVLAHAIALSTGGIPVLYLGDEVAQMNDYGYRNRPAEAEDSRWVGRPHRPAEAYAVREDERTVAGRVHQRLRRLLAVRRDAPQLAGNDLVPFHVPHRSVIGFQRPGEVTSFLVLANVGDGGVPVDPVTLSGLDPQARELIADVEVDLREGAVIPAHGVLWLEVRPRG